MRKVIVFNLISLDGYFADSNGDIDWHVVDDEFNKAAVEMIKAYDTILFGRVTYQLFESYWPGAAKDLKTSKEDRIIADKINEMKKVVFSKTFKKVTWENSKLFKDNLEKEVRKLKKGKGKNIVIYGSGTIVQQLTNAGLIDEYRLMVNPVILGNGKPMFKDLHDSLKLKLLRTKTFKSGNVLLYYEPVK